MKQLNSSEILLQAQSISKKYFPQKRAMSFRETISSLFSKENSRGDKSLLALNEISFEVRRGEVLGIIGKNGAGKSTLMRILSGITNPTQGRVIFNGKVTSILEVGTGFHPELSGKENIYLSGILLGMTEDEIQKREQEIIEFSGIAGFMDVPVKRYSGGMFLRLAFSVAVHLIADILLIDEVLSVGDTEFRHKSFLKIQSLTAQKKAVIIVSHDLGSVAGLCDRVLILEQGKIRSEGKPATMIADYIEQAVIALNPEHKANLTEKTSGEIVKEKTLALAKSWDEPVAPGNDLVKIFSISVRGISDTEIFMDDPLRFEITYKKYKKVSSNLSLFLSWQMDQPVLSITPYRSIPVVAENDDGPGLYRVNAEFPGSWFNCGLFSLSLFFITSGQDELMHLPDLLTFRIRQEKENLQGVFIYDGNFPGPLFPRIHWKRSRIG